MALQRVTIWWGPNGEEVFVNWDDITQEVEQVGAVNPGPVTWEISYVWKSRQDDYTLNPSTPEFTVGIPPGQRFTLPVDPQRYHPNHNGSELVGFDVAVV
jgi:hypothetical protein